ncbi:MAG: transcription-repair coupling factor [Chloroflexi bacterium]|nr:transcription-repair coupling factor [Chloroflexota bacterium]
MLTGLTEIVEAMPQFQQLVGDLRANRKGSASILQSAQPLLVGAVWREMRVPVLVVTPRPEDARRMHDRLLTYFGEDAAIYSFAELEALPFERLTADTATMHQRLGALAALAGMYLDAPPPLVVTSAVGVALKTLSPQRFLPGQGHHVLRRGEQAPMEGLLERWAALGYRMERTTEVPGTMSRRGGIVDIFPTGDPYPVRLEFWGDIVETLRTFDPGTQRSLEPVDEVMVIPARELLPLLSDQQQMDDAFRGLDFSRCPSKVFERMEEELSMMLTGQDVEEAGFYSGFFNSASVLDFLPDDGLLVLDQFADVESVLREMDRRAWDLREVKVARGDLPGGFPSPYFGLDELSARLSARRRLDLTRWSGEEFASFPFIQAPSFWSQLEPFLAETQERQRRGERVVIVTNHAQRLRELLLEHDLGPRMEESLDGLPPAGSITLVRGSLSDGWLATYQSGVALFTDSEVFGTAKVSRPRRRHAVPQQSFTSEIEPGSYVVHTDHGVARFAGSTTLGSGEEEREYLVLEYASGDKLYVPSDHTDRVGLYVSPGDQAPTLTRLGTQEWSRAKERVKRSAQEMAQELLKLYAQREVTPGISIAADTPWQLEMEDAFPYVETPDQVVTIAQVKEDMERARPMDRLVCGDVGYGKTEIALRAAFKAVASGMQVAILVPTTLLAQQHYVTLSQRLSAYPVTVDVLSRFRSDKEQREVVEALAQGKIDICIGTHRLLQKDVKFKDLGLVVVDEEHRFGVRHKERFKQMRAQVDVLTLTATPIPRTLHMALSGLRDMSTMETPPEERLPIKTYVSEETDELIRDAILRELDRGGQVYFLHNRVRSIDRVAESLRKLVPEATVGVGHGRMSEETLERSMADFGRGDTDVLVCTTIIESGLDLPNVNTLIVDRADRLGLAQMYQLRGRIGRGSRRAYAYFLIPRDRRITETAQKRLETILAATELGAGFRIAMKDLEIRGAGQLLGGEQSGHIHAVGFDLYARLLAQAVEDVRESGDLPVSLDEPETADITINLKLPARIPVHYVEDLATRLGLYQRLGRAGSPDDIAQVQEEMRDRFGSLPPEVHNLLYTVRVRVLAFSAGVEAVNKEARSVAVRLRDDVGGAKAALQRELGPHVRVGNRLLHLDTRKLDRPWGQALLELLEGVTAFKERMVGVGVG